MGWDDLKGGFRNWLKREFLFLWISGFRGVFCSIIWVSVWKVKRVCFGVRDVFGWCVE